MTSTLKYFQYWEKVYELFPIAIRLHIIPLDHPFLILKDSILRAILCTHENFVARISQFRKTPLIRMEAMRCPECFLPSKRSRFLNSIST
jgi:hypothetical protein